MCVSVCVKCAYVYVMCVWARMYVCVSDIRVPYVRIRVARIRLFVAILSRIFGHKKTLRTMCIGLDFRVVCYAIALRILAI